MATDSSITTTTPKDFSFCIVVPMYNEASNAKACVDKLSAFLKELDYETALIVTNDGSTDDTWSVLQGLQSQNDNLLLENHEVNQGYGAANVTGAVRARKENFKYVLFMDADLTQDCKYIYPFIDLMKQDIDFIKATRYADGGNTEGVSFGRRIISRVGNMIAQIFLPLPITDYTNGFRAIKSDILAQITAEERGFAYLIEEVNKASKIVKTYAEVPYTLTVREDEFSESKFVYSPKVYLTYLKWVFKR
ncbi:MAG TPA: glycosyltransferase [Micavibrio sp.]|nr:glycosyltransferase [Micavibrio sp.]